MRLIFDDDIFLETEFPVAYDSPDHYEEVPDGAIVYNSDKEATEFGKYLMRMFPDHGTLIDLGTACGMLPLRLRELGMRAVGLEGSDRGKDQGIGCWKIDPGIIRTCDISRPFRITNKDGDDFKFDLVVSFGTFEHIHPDRMVILWDNVKRLMHKNSVGMFNIDMGYNRYHLSGGLKREDWQQRIEVNFELMRDMTFDPNGEFRDHPYYRPNDTDREYLKEHDLPFHSGRTFWWVKLKR